MAVILVGLKVLFEQNWNLILFSPDNGLWLKISYKNDWSKLSFQNEALANLSGLINPLWKPNQEKACAF